MEKKIILSITFLSCFFMQTSALEPTAADRSQSIDKEIELTEQKIHEIHLKIMKSEVQSQDYIKYEWADYAKTIQMAEEEEQELAKLHKHLQQLQEQKKNYLKTQAQPEK